MLHQRISCASYSEYQQSKIENEEALAFRNNPMIEEWTNVLNESNRERFLKAWDSIYVTI